MMEQNEAQPLDGNAAAGVLSEVFWRDMTLATGRCASCGREGPFAEARLYGGLMGYVMRCPGCDGVLMRVAKTPHGFWLEMQGLRSLTFENTPGI